MFVTVAFSANNLRASVSLYAIMVQIYNQGVVSPKAPIGLGLRGFGAAGMCLGTLLCGFRLCAVTGTALPSHSCINGTGSNKGNNKALDTDHNYNTAIIVTVYVHMCAVINPIAVVAVITVTVSSS